VGVQEAKELFLGICDPRQMERLIDMIYEDPPYIPGVLLDYMTRQKCRLSILDIRKAKGIYRPDGGWIFSDLLPDYAQAIKAPTLILWGDQDKIAHPKNAEAFHRIIPHSRFQYIRKAGHVPAMEYPQKSAKVVWDFLKDLEGKP
jgi:pimeloyl-ACP methyl ester carboxylesterase